MYIDDAYIHIEHVVEVNPQVEEDPAMEGERDEDIIWESSQREQWAS